jgi:hypothetical protein
VSFPFSSPLPSLTHSNSILRPASPSHLRKLCPGGDRTGEPVRGSTALLTGYLVAYTQLIPEHQVQIFGRLKIRVKVSLFFTLACTLIPMVSCEVLSGIGIGFDTDVDFGIWFGNE